MRYLAEKRARIEIIPMIDIMLFLLVFFAMLMLRMIPTSGQVTKLPTSSTAQALPTPKLLVELKQDGSMWVDRETMTTTQLTAKLKTMGDKTAVTISGDKDVDLQKVMAVLDAVKSSGVTQVAIAAKTQN